MTTIRFSFLGAKLPLLLDTSPFISCTGCSADYILFGKLEDNDEISKINRILNSCSENLKTYMYELITSSFKYLKGLNKK